MTDKSLNLQKQRRLSEIVADIVSSTEVFTDIHIETDRPVMLRQSGYNWIPVLDDEGRELVIKQSEIIAFLNAIYTGQEREPSDIDRSDWRQNLHKQGSLHPAVNLSKLVDGKLLSYRMRCTVQKQMMGETIGLVLRPILPLPDSIQKLGLPIHVEKMLRRTYRGLIIVTGPTGSGKSTTLASMISEVNQYRSGNIITIEDPVEYVHERKKCIINQREIGIDVNSFAAGVHDAMRFVPDVILIGEIRDADTMRQAVRAAESGCLVLASMHAPTPVGAIRKMFSYLSESQGDMQGLAYLLVGVVAQILIRDIKGKGKNHLATGYLDCTDDRVVKTIVESALGDSSYEKLALMEKQLSSGELTCGISMLQSLKDMVAKGLIDVNAALSGVSTNEEKMQLRKLITK